MDDDDSLGPLPGITVGTGVAQHPETTHREPGLVNPVVDIQRLMFNRPYDLGRHCSDFPPQVHLGM